MIEIILIILTFIVVILFFEFKLYIMKKSIKRDCDELLPIAKNLISKLKKN